MLVCGQVLANAAEYGFHCPHCNINLSDFMLAKKLVKGLADLGMKTEFCVSFPRHTASDMIKICEMFQSAQKTAPGNGAGRCVAAAEGLQEAFSAHHNGDEIATGDSRVAQQRNTSAMPSGDKRPAKCCRNCGRK